MIPHWLHCASLLRTIFASLACAHERVHVLNVRDRQRNKCLFLSNEHGDLYFYCVIIAYVLYSLIKKKFKKIIGRKKDRAEKHDSRMQIMWSQKQRLEKHLTSRRFKWCNFKTNLYGFVLYARDFHPVKFHSSITLMNYHASSHRKLTWTNE